AGPEIYAGMAQAAQAYGEGWRLPHNPPDADRRTDFLLKSANQALRVQNPVAARLKRTYVLFTAKPADSFLKPLMEQMSARARAAGWHYQERAWDHFPLLDQPQEVASLLLELI